MTPALEQIKALPALPEPVDAMVFVAWGPKPDLYTAEQMREYALQALRDEAGDAVAFRRHYPEGGCSGWYDAKVEASLLTALQQSGQQIEFAYRPAPAAEATPQGGDGMLPDALVPVAREWYALCERAAYVDRIRISGKLAEAIVAAVVKGAATPPSAPAVEAPDSLVIGECGWVDPVTRDNDSLIACMVQNYSRAAHSDNRKQYAAYQACQRELIRRLSAPAPQEGVDAPRATLTITHETAADVLHRYLANAPDGDHWPPDRQRELRIEAMRNAVTNALEAALAAGALPQGMVLVPRALAEMAVTVASEWLDLFADTPGLEKYDRFTYGPQVELLRDDLTAALAAAPAQGVR